MKDKLKISSKKVDVFYGENQALNKINLDIFENKVTSLIGPSGCGKSTFLRCLNRMNDTIDSCIVTGKILIDDSDIYEKSVDPVLFNCVLEFQVPFATPPVAVPSETLTAVI